MGEGEVRERRRGEERYGCMRRGEGNRKEMTRILTYGRPYLE